MPAKIGGRTMGWFTIPKKLEKIHLENCISVEVDFEKYICKDFRVLPQLIKDMGFTGEIDIDNSNVEFLPDGVTSLTNTNTANGHAYKIVLNLPGFAPLPVIDIEIYRDSHAKTLRSDGAICFYGAFFRFRDIMKEQAPVCETFYKKVRSYSGGTAPLFHRNRIDIALDIKNISVDQKWETDYIKPQKGTKRIVHHYNYQKSLGGYQSFAYLPPVGQGIGIRIYNKVLDIISKNKQSWYPDIDTTKDTVTRIELVFMLPFSLNEDELIISLAKNKILGTGHSSKHMLHYVNPCTSYSAFNAYKYFARYSKNNGTQLETILCDVQEIHTKKQNNHTI